MKTPQESLVHLSYDVRWLTSDKEQKKALNKMWK